MKQNVQNEYSRKPAWRNFGAILAATIFCSFPSLAASSGEFMIVSRGQAKAEIVVEPSSADAPLAFATQELQRYLKQMSGAELPVVHAPTKKSAIVLAVRQSQPGNKALEDPREHDHYRLSIDARNLNIEGASPRAV